MISQSGHMVLVDFGIAELGSGIYETEGGPNGTPGYIAPEAHPVEQSGRTHYSAYTADIYSMGVVFLQMYLAPVDSNVGCFAFSSMPLLTSFSGRIFRIRLQHRHGCSG